MISYELDSFKLLKRGPGFGWNVRLNSNGKFTLSMDNATVEDIGEIYEWAKEVAPKTKYVVEFDYDPTNLSIGTYTCGNPVIRITPEMVTKVVK